MKVDFTGPRSVTRRIEVEEDKTGGTVTMVSIDTVNGSASISVDVGEPEPLRIFCSLTEEPDTPPGAHTQALSWKDSVRPLLGELVKFLNSQGIIAEEQK